MLVLALSSGHKVGLAVVAALFITFALGSSFLFPRLRPQYPGRGLPAFIVVTFIFFLGMLSAVEIFGAEPKEAGARPEAGAAPTTEATTTTPATTAEPTSPAKTITQPTTTAAPKPRATTVAATETEFKITLAALVKAGKVTFQVKNTGKIPHDLRVEGNGVDAKTKLLSPGASATLATTLKPGTYELTCTVPGHKEAGMKLELKVS